MHKKCKVVMLPTKKASKIWMNFNDDDLKVVATKSLSCYKHEQRIGSPGTPQHLYILSDDEIKEGDWFSDGKKLYHSNVQLDGYINLYKVIATTDSSLKIYNSGHHKESTPELSFILIPSIPQLFIEKYVNEYNKGNKIEEAMVEYYTTWVDVPGYPKPFKDVKLEDGIQVLFVQSDNTINTKPVKDSWTRDEVKQLLIDCCSEVSSIDGILKGKDPADLYMWIEENL